MSEKNNGPNDMSIDYRKKFIATERRFTETMNENTILKRQRENLKKRLKDHSKLIRDNKALSERNKALCAKLKTKKASMVRLKDKNHSKTKKLESKLHQSQLEIFKLTRSNETPTNPRFSKKKTIYKSRKLLLEDNQKLTSKYEGFMGELNDLIDFSKANFPFKIFVRWIAKKI